MSILSQLFGKVGTRPKPFYTNNTREERKEWFSQTRPWDRLPSTVIDAVLDGITDKLLLEVFVLTSMENGLVARYEPLGRGDSNSKIIRAQISQILCQTGSRAVASLEKAMETKPRDEVTKAKLIDEAEKAFNLAKDTFEPAISLEKTQIVAYVGMATAHGMVGKKAECQDWAKRGMVELVEAKKELRRISDSIERSGGSKGAYLPGFIDGLDQMERHLRSCLDA
jgi:hypothetical protein